MALLAFPRRKRSARLSDRVADLTDHRLVREVRAGLHGLPSRTDLPIPTLPASLPSAIPALTDLVEAVIEAGAKHSPVRVSVRRPRKKRRAASMMLVVAVVGGLVLAYRWWQKRDQDAAGLLDEPDDSDHGPTAMPPPPNPWADSAPRSEPDVPSAPTDGPRASLPVEAEACVEAPSDAPKPWVAPRRAEMLRPWEAGRAATFFGRGPSVAAPAVPASRPSVPDRHEPHLPR
jgi:hypothetical protein